MSEIDESSKPTKRTKTGGRKRGTPNKVSGDVKTVIAAVVDHGAARAEELFDRVAARHPARALALLTKLAEFVVPKLRTHEVTGPAGAALPMPNFTISFPDGGPGREALSAPGARGADGDDDVEVSGPSDEPESLEGAAPQIAQEPRSRAPALPPPAERVAAAPAVAEAPRSSPWESLAGWVHGDGAVEPIPAARLETRAEQAAKQRALNEERVAADNSVARRQAAERVWRQACDDARADRRPLPPKPEGLE